MRTRAHHFADTHPGLPHALGGTGLIGAAVVFMSVSVGAALGLALAGAALVSRGGYLAYVVARDEGWL